MIQPADSRKVPGFRQARAGLELLQNNNYPLELRQRAGNQHLVVWVRSRNSAPSRQGKKVCRAYSSVYDPPDHEGVP